MNPGYLPYPPREVPRRGELLQAAVAEANLGPIVAPQDYGLDPIGEVHDHGLLSVLQDGYRHAAASGGAALADTFSVRAAPQRVPRSIAGQLGYYSFDLSAPLLAHTWTAAYWAAQTAVTAAAQVSGGEDRVAYALCRPPGHHAGVDLFGGYCYLNNAAIAAHWLVQQGQRVAILDLDYHHGNGTQSVFYARSDVLVCSIHADPFDAFPYFWGYADEYGRDAGRNHNFNYPLPPGTGESRYLQVLAEVMQRVKNFVPDIMLVSLGLDIRAGDPEGSFDLDAGGLARIGARLAQAGLPMVVVQEGGYQLETLQESIVAFFRGLLQPPAA